MATITFNQITEAVNKVKAYMSKKANLKGREFVDETWNLAYTIGQWMSENNSTEYAAEYEYIHYFASFNYHQYED